SWPSPGKKWCRKSWSARACTRGRRLKARGAGQLACVILPAPAQRLTPGENGKERSRFLTRLLSLYRSIFVHRL
ncbi:MAG: hypothetical protein K6U74_03570, partial [Firmicutes bacterium]|nr:hypothetical protein [Bacillota bacterium]